MNDYGNITEQLKLFILEKYKSIREFAISINMPYSTIDNIFKRGIDKANVSNVISICQALNISTDMLACGKIISNSHSEQYSNRRIREKREQLGLTQEELALKLGYKSRSSINKIELGENDIPQSKIIAFAKALDTTPSYLMGWESADEILYKDEISEELTNGYHVPLSQKEVKLIESYRTLNDEGQEKIIDSVDDLIRSGKYIKNNTVGLDYEKQA